MSTKADEHMDKAKRMLKQALALEPGHAPEAIVHLSYYAMFHAATSVHLRRGFEPAKTHGGLIGTFGRFAKGLSQEAQEQGKALNRAEDLRLTADYGASVPDLDQTSMKVRTDAERFVVFCENLPSQ